MRSISLPAGEAMLRVHDLRDAFQQELRAAGVKKA